MVADHIYDAVLEALIDGALEPGSAIVIDALARQFDVSQTPVREALARLESTGLVRRTALKGYRVAPMTTRDELDRLMQARLVFEPKLAELTAGRMSTHRVDARTDAELQQAVDDLASASLGPSFAEFRAYWEADERFHRLVAEAAGNEFLLSAYVALGGQIVRFRLFGGSGVTDSEHCVAEHTRVLEALRSGDPAAAGRAMAAHIDDARVRALNSIDEAEHTHPHTAPAASTARAASTASTEQESR
ncbi:GntR family transcriptional regulator [Subtercola boreus]|uniref:GntR family transcriptional regulator n=2 Tax=Subtercola boreus TaxID=120213 RepID=A0A3E0W8S7_9MICO|nr:GntR family transcriptional regulator [Subtercola boreus]RFA19496.1 GntR family transcriptional regulator [Subtercola boreus]RFA19756.1 GntR family transcriptional regulator [Subtercola boreus]RFA25976.1 GntR family transcriptional regulator [Subtercola boreus]